MNILISGYGRMGRQLVEAIKQEQNHQVGGIIDYKGENGYQSIQDVTEHIDVIIDFSHPSCLSELLHYATANKVPVVIATTNYSETDIEAIHKASTSIPIFHSSNTSFGIQVLLQAIKTVQRLIPEADIEIVETHHRNKVDAPSGTAQMIITELQNQQSKPIYGRKGDTVRNPYEIGVHSIRGGSVAGTHEVQFFLNGEHITVTHQAESKDVFVQGALRAAAFVVTRKNGYYTMNDLIEEYVK